MTRHAMAMLALSLAACGPRPVGLEQPDALTLSKQPPAPGYVLLPAVDQRPEPERDGSKPGITLRFVTAGAAIFWTSGADVRGDSDVIWSRNRFTGMGTAASTVVSSDLGRVLEQSTRRPVAYWARPAVTGADVARVVTGARIADGTIVVLPVIDHLVEVHPSTKQASAAQYETTTHRVTETSHASQSTSKTWTVMVRLHAYEIRGARPVRHVVRYAAASGGRDAYTRAIQLAALEVAHVSSTYFSLPRRAAR